MSWDLVSDRPIYIQLVDEIKLRIITNYYKPGERIPTVRELAAEAEVNPNTMQRALAELESSGLVITNRTSGRVVTDDTKVIKDTKFTIADEVTEKYMRKMETLGFNIGETVKFITKENNINE